MINLKCTIAALASAVSLAGPAMAQSAAAPQATPDADAGTPAPAETAPKTDSARADANAPPRDESRASSELPAGTIVVKLTDPDGRPKANVRVRLGILFQTIAEGESRTEQTKTSDDQGLARFDGLRTGSDHSYQVHVEHGGARRNSEPFQLRTEMGHSVRINLYPVTSNVKDALIGMRSIVYIEPRDDVFQFDVMFQVYNMGRVSWVPNDLVLQMPTGYKGFTTQEQMSEVGVVNTDRGVRLTGTFSPGQHELSFRFQVPNDHDERVRFRVELPPHVAELRVMAESAPGMTLSSPGFGSAQTTTNQNGQRIQLLQKRLARGEVPAEEVIVELSGIPVPGPGRWLATLLALGFAATGLTVAARKQTPKRPLVDQELTQAQSLLLNELVALERARQSELIGPHMYEQTRRALIDGLLRLGVAELAAPRRRKRQRAIAREPKASEL